MTKAIYPGTFDPVTRGHLDVIQRASEVFDDLVVGVGNNPAKSCTFSLRERLALLRAETRRLKNVTIKSFRGLVIHFAKAEGVVVILRGVRTVSDFDYELHMAFANRTSGGIETIFMTPTPECEFISGKLVKEIAAQGGDVSRLVSPAVEKKLKTKLKSKGGK